MAESNGVNVRLPVAVCAAAANVLVGSHQALEELFLAAGAPGPPPNLAHHSKWKVWLQRVGNDPSVDSLSVLGALIEEFMDLPPLQHGESEVFGFNVPDPLDQYVQKKERLVRVLDEHGFRYFPGGRVLPLGSNPNTPETIGFARSASKPTTVEGLLQTIIQGLPRAMHPLTHRRKGATVLRFDTEYDIQDLLHALMRPWISDIRPEEYTPSYAGSSARMDFLLPEYRIVLEIKRVRDKTHAKNISNELIIDIEHYRRHEGCARLWCVVYDPAQLVTNPSGLAKDLEGSRSTPDGNVDVRVFVFGGN